MTASHRNVPLAVRATFPSTRSSASLPAGPAALFVAHPGHELRLHGWLELVSPVTFVLTDGSGHTSTSRLPSTTRLLKACGARPGSIYGRFSDRDVYRAILDRQVETFAATVSELAAELETEGVTHVVADSWELYNPSHDLCRVMADLAVEVIHERSGAVIGTFDFDTVHPRKPGVGAVTIVLDDAALERKLAAARGYVELRNEYEAALTEGVELLRAEILHPAATPAAPTNRPYYETHGEHQVALGYYTEVVRYRSHFLPLLERLRSELGLRAFAARVSLSQV
ncbi:MAG: uncharacterized protein JWN02_2488 [Acidobacteria bacterium]|nr:uncharacterized protein [Acidobacteriota bacterium]